MFSVTRGEGGALARPSQGLWFSTEARGSWKWSLRCLSSKQHQSKPHLQSKGNNSLPRLRHDNTQCTMNFMLQNSGAAPAI